MAITSVAAFLKRVGQLKKKEEKIAALRHNDSFVLRTVLQGAFDPRIEWILPPGEVPYTPNKLVDQENVFIRDARLLKHFVKGGTPGLNRMKMEMMFIELLEAVCPADAEMLVALKDKKMFKGITEDLVRETFPDLLPEKETAAADEQDQAQA